MVTKELFGNCFNFLRPNFKICQLDNFEEIGDNICSQIAHFKTTICFKRCPHAQLFRPTLVGEELCTEMVFFVQKILADRYNHRRE